GVGHRTTGFDRRNGGPKQCIEAVENQKRTDACANMRGIGPGEDSYACRHPERRTKHKRPEFSPVQRAAQFPDRVALHDQAERYDQGRRLNGIKDVKPDRGCDQAERKAGQPRDQRTRKGREKEQRNFKEKSIHVLAPTTGEQRLNGIAISWGGFDIPSLQVTPVTSTQASGGALYLPSCPATTTRKSFIICQLTQKP